MNLPRLLRTLSYLKPVQIYGRLAFRLARPRPRLDLPAVRGASTGTWVAPVSVSRRQVGTRFRFLNVERDVRTAADWCAAEADALWLYNLHYFDDLRASDAATRFSEQSGWIARWIAENPPGLGIGWDPYPTSLRIANWVKWALSGGELGPPALRSLACQADWLSRRIEHHLQGNHLLANAKGLLFAGLFMGDQPAERWRALGWKLLFNQLDEQILADGGHYERSPMYHALATEDLLDLLNLSRWRGNEAALPDAARLASTAQQMMAWLEAMTHPDGGIAFFNDAAHDIAPTLGELRAYSDRLGLLAPTPAAMQLVHLAHSGYVRLTRGRAVLLVDVAELGPDHQAGHAHADTLSFELSLGRDRVLVNSGTSRYDSGSERLRQRSTAAHNTVEINGLDSSEVWSSFRVGRRARPRDVELTETDTNVAVRAHHDGYAYLPGHPLHERRWEFGPGELHITDRIIGSCERALASFHFAPGVRVHWRGSEVRGRVALPDGAELELEARRGSAHLEPATYHPRFGVEQPCQVLRLELDDGSAELRIQWNEP